MSTEKVGHDMIATDTLLTIEEVCSLLKVHSRTLWLLRGRGEFVKEIKFGNSIRFRRDDVTAWLEARAL